MSKIKNNLINTLSIALAVVTLLGSINWTVNVHYCGAELINYAFIGEAEGCGMEEFDNVCEAPQNADSYNKTCCSNNHRLFQ